MIRRAGFTLVEVIVVIVLLGIIGSAFGMFILPAFQSYQAVARRADLTDAAESALRRMARDIRISLPNSVRVTNTGTGFALEMIPTIDGGRYCVNAPGNCTVANVLDFTAPDAEFDILGFFSNPAFTGTPVTSTAYRLVIGNAGNEVYSGGSPSVITPLLGQITFSRVTGPPDRHHITLDTVFAFDTPSARNRVFVIKTESAPVSYVCDKSTTPGTLKRYTNYAFAPAQPNPPGVAGQLVANNLTACAVSSDTSLVRDFSLVTVDLTVSNSGETIRLIQQVQLDNSI